MQEQASLGSFQYNFIKVLSYYENKVKEGMDLMFRFHLIPKEAEKEKSVQTTLDSISAGNNLRTFINLTVLRVMHLNRCTFTLCTSSRPFSMQSLVIVILVYPQKSNEEAVNMDSYELGKKSVIRVYEPFKVKEEQQIIPTLVVSLQNMVVVKGKQEQRIKRTSQELREQANSFFKAKKYVQAIHLYQNALSSIHRPDPRKLSILYSNTAACLFELRLFSSCVILSEVAILMDPTYNKGYYRKLRSLLELKGFQLATPLLLTISTLINKSDFDQLNERFTHLSAQAGGVFNWRGLLRGSVPQGEYTSEKVDFTFIQDQLRYYAREPIAQYQLLLIAKPFIYIQQNGGNFKDSFMAFLKQIQVYYLYDETFEQLIHTLPCKCHPKLIGREQYFHEFKGMAKPMPKKELFNKMQRCIFEQKSIDKAPQQNGYGIWKQMFYFDNKCYPNCTAVHLNGYWLVTALQPIQVGTVLSVDLIAGVEASKRKETLHIKMQQDCDCQICGGIQINENSFTTIQQLYDEIQLLQNMKKKKQHIWSIINNQWDRLTFFQGDYTHLIYYYIYYVEKECQWDDFLNLIRLKDEIDHEQINKHIDEVAVRLMTQFFKTDDREAEYLYHLVLNKHGIELES